MRVVPDRLMCAEGVAAIRKSFEEDYPASQQTSSRLSKSRQLRSEDVIALDPFDDGKFVEGVPNAILQLRPTCENCNKLLPPDSLEARICSFECTFCAQCAEGVLANVCPNCGGGFTPRPIRPSRDWKGGNYLGAKPATSEIRHRPVDPEVHAEFAAAIKNIPAEER